MILVKLNFIKKIKITRTTARKNEMKAHTYQCPSHRCRVSTKKKIKCSNFLEK